MSRRASRDTPLFACMEPEIEPEPERIIPQIGPGLTPVNPFTEARHPVKCLRCGKVNPWDHFDCLGLDDDDLQCPNCGHVAHMERFT